MRRTHYLIVILLGFLAAWGMTLLPPKARLSAGDEPKARPAQNEDPAPGYIETAGKTKPVPGRLAKIAPAVLHPVIKVLVVPGQRVKAEEPLVEIDNDEPQAELEGKQASLTELKAGLARLKSEPRNEEQEEARACLEGCRICSQEASHLFDRLNGLWQKGSISEQRYHEAKAALSKCSAEERAAHMRLQRLLKRPYAQEIAELEARIAVAEAAVKVAHAELEHYTVTAPIAGVVTSLDVSLGTVSRPGTSVWGEIMDLSEIDVCCDLTPEQADRVAVGMSAEVFPAWNKDKRFTGRVVLVSLAADPKTGLVPVVVRIGDNKERLRAHVEVKVRLACK